MNNITSNRIEMIITSTPITIDDRDLRDGLFEVPLYQREYSWELEQVSDLFYDIQNSEDTDGHFLGSILLHKIDENKKEIIDGQQRITTLFLILYGIRKALRSLDAKSDDRIDRGCSRIDNIIYLRTKKVSTIDENIEPRLTTGIRDKKLFKAILQGAELNDKNKKVKDGRRKSHKLLLNAIDNFITPKIQEILNSDGVTGVLTFLDKVTSCQYIVMTAEKKEDERLLFKTLNSRGVELSESDLIKNEVCRNIKGGESDVLAAVNLWDGMRDILEANNANVDLFLFHFINSLPDSQEIRKEIESNILSKPNSNSYPPISEKLLFSAFEHKIKSLSNTIDFLEDLKLSASTYIEISNPTESKVKDKSITYLKGLKAMNITKCYPLLLRGKFLLNSKNFERLSQSIECLSFRHSILKKDPKELEKFYYNLLLKLKSDDDIEDTITNIRTNPTMKDDDGFKTQFLLSSPKSSVSKMILQRIIAYQQQEPIDFSQKSIWLEHIMPQTPAGEWLSLYEKDKDEYDNLLNCLGNLTFIQFQKNIGASNKNFNVKKTEYYSNSLIQLNKNILEYDNWDFSAIEKRQGDLYEIAKEIWKIE